MKLRLITPGRRRHGTAPMDNIARNYATCCGGDVGEHTPAGDGDAALVLLEKPHMRAAAALVDELSKRGAVCWLGFADSDPGTPGELLADVTRFQLFQNLCGSAHGAVGSSRAACGAFQAAGVRHVLWLPEPVLSGDPASPDSGKRGIFLGSDSFASPWQDHAEALLRANRLSVELQVPLAVVNSEGRNGGMILKSLRQENPLLFLIEAPVPDDDYRRVVGLHRIVWIGGHGGGITRAQRASLENGIPSVGGLQRQEAAVDARELLTNDGYWTAHAASQIRDARDWFGFEASARALEEFIERTRPR
jgi:hypothetical protein